MKKLFVVLMLSLAFVACDKDNYEYVPENNDTQYGTLSFAGMNISTSTDLDIITRADDIDVSDYKIYIYNSNNELHNGKSYTYGDILSNGNASIDLLEGTYKIEVRSQESFPNTTWDKQIYGAIKEGINVVAGQTTAVGAIVCTLLQCRVSVDYSDDFLAMVAGDCNVVVSVDGGELNFPITYSTTGKHSYEKRDGYFKVNGKTTMEVKFSGQMYDEDGNKQTQRMTKAFEDVEPHQWRQIKFIKKINPEGNATFDIEIEDRIEDNPLGEDPSTEGEESIGTDPNAPQGDGGITLTPMNGSDIVANNILVVDATNIDTWETSITPIEIAKIDASATPTMTLTMNASVPNGVRKFSVTITTNSDGFNKALELVGGNVIDLVDPAEAANTIFEVVPFPHGNDLLGKTSIDFNLSNAQGPISIFAGTHNFLLTVVDQKGCTKKYAIAMHIAE